MNLETFEALVKGKDLTRRGFPVITFKTDVFSKFSDGIDAQKLIAIASNPHLVMKIKYLPYISHATFSKSEKEFFSIRDFVWAKSVMPMAEFETQFRKQGAETEEQYLGRTLDFIIQFVAEHLNQFVDGSRWENIPHDWQGYK